MHVVLIFLKIHVSYNNLVNLNRILIYYGFKTFGIVVNWQKTTEQ